MAVLVTGGAGFIGFHVCLSLLARGERVISLDNVNDYYNPQLKRDRLAVLASEPGFTQIQADIRDIASAMPDGLTPSHIVHLAAQAGVRYSIDNPQAYVESNMDGFVSVLEYARRAEIAHLVYASSSSVYGANRDEPFSVADSVNQPVSLYAATKRSNELMAHAYSELFGIPLTGMRLFTVYGPWGRPDMAYFKFARSILAGEPIQVFEGGRLHRDFTYVDDAVSGIIGCLDRAPVPSQRCGSGINESSAPHRVFNLGRGEPVTVLQMVQDLEVALGKSAVVVDLPRPLGDVAGTMADIRETQEWCGYNPKVSFREGAHNFVAWLQGYMRGDRTFSVPIQPEDDAARRV